MYWYKTLKNALNELTSKKVDEYMLRRMVMIVIKVEQKSRQKPGIVAILPRHE